MPDLVAQGSSAEQRWRRAVPADQWIVVGRAAGNWSVAWDDRVSRRHVRIRWRGGRLNVERVPDARNPVFYQGQSHDRFSVRPGEHFVIGGTSFLLADERIELSQADDAPLTEQVFSPGYLQRVPFRDANRRIELVSRLPEIISGAANDAELYVRVVNILMSGVERATAAALVAAPPAESMPETVGRSEAGAADVRILHWDHRGEYEGGFAPSARLIQRAVEREESVIHVWSRPRSSAGSPPATSNDLSNELANPLTNDASLPRNLPRISPNEPTIVSDTNLPQLNASKPFTSQPSSTQTAAAPRSTKPQSAKPQAVEPQFTQSEDLDWAFCTPLTSDPCRGWALYVAGKLAGGDAATHDARDPADLRDEVKFVELTASMLTALRRMRVLERKDASLRSFFSPVVLEALAEHDPDEILAPREVNVSVLFCDLRGFSRRSEASADDLLGLLQRVSRALGVMTYHILDQGGVVGDFHGDAAMGFWGWPLEQPDAAERACRAALGIQAEFAAAASDAMHPLANFRMGIGIATGRAVAGKIGTIDQVKVTVFGPVVNLASRLEGLTKHVRAPILLDPPTAEIVRERLARDEARVRRVATLRPSGMSASVEVSQLLPGHAADSLLTDEHIAAYEAALDALAAGDWSQAFSLLHAVPAEDRVKDLLTVFIAQNNRTPPPDWDGVIPHG